MKNERLLDLMNLLDDKYIDEANPENKKTKKKVNWLKFGLIASCICLIVTAMNLFLFIPFTSYVPDVSEYESSEYFPIIEKLNALSVVKPEYKNNFDKIFSSLLAIGKGVNKNEDVDFDANDSTPLPDGVVGDKGEEGYEEITDNQVEGVVEGDLIKRSDKYIYYLSNNILNIYSIEGENSKLVGYLDVSDYFIGTDISIANYSKEMYLSQNCNTITIVSSYISGGDSYSCTDGKSNIKTGTIIIALDVSDATKISQKNYVLVDGVYSTSRAVSGKLLVITKKAYYNIDYSKPETFIPRICYDKETKSELIPMSNIACPDTITSKNYNVISLLDEDTLDFNGCAGFLSYSDDIYVTNNSIYATSKSSEDISDAVSIKRKTITEISCISYGEEFDVKGSIKLDGYIKDRYSLDEYKGVLRIVTTNQYFLRKYFRFDGNESFFINSSDYTSASLYCIDLDSWNVIASVEKFAPSGETVRSVKFDKDYLYVCTAVQLTDPVFYFDLSDINNITYKETGNIEGFSTSLINLGNGYLLGIGVGNSRDTIKVEVYIDDESSVKSVCSYEIEHAYYSTSYKSYYVDRENQLFGFGYTSYLYDKGDYSKYVLLLFSNGELIELVNTSLAGENDEKRAVYIDGYLYMLGYKDFKVIKIL